MTTPFFLRLSKTIEQAERFQNQAKLQAAINKARNEALPTKKKKSVFGEAIKMAANFTPNVVEDVAKSTGRGLWGGLQGWNNQVQSVPAALFTKGKVQDGQYTTERNLIGNPFANVVSHVEAQRKLGIAPKGGNILEDIGAGFESARLAGKAYEEDPDIASGVKFGTGVIFDPTSYLAAGTISKLPKIAGIGGAKGKLARAPINLIEGFDSPAQVGKFAVGGAIGTELANKYDVPGVPEGLEQFLGGMGGGITGAAFNPRKFEAGLAKMQGREGKPAAAGFGTEVVEEGERLYHGTPTHIPKGEIIISPRGDLDAGFYLTRDYEIANSTVEGDTANVTNFPGDFIEERRNKILEEGGQQVMRFKPKDRDLLLLRWSERLTEDEAARINNVLKKRKLEPIANTSLTPQGFIQKLRPNREGYGGQTPGALGVFIEAGFDGFSEDIGGYPQLTVFKPNEVLEEVLTPPTVLKGSAQKRAAMEQPAPKLSGKVESTVGDVPDEVEIFKENGKWFFLSPNGYKGMAYDSFADAKADAKAYGYKPVFKGPISEIDNVSPSLKPVKFNFNDYADLLEKIKVAGKAEDFYAAADELNLTNDDQYMALAIDFVKKTDNKKVKSTQVTWDEDETNVIPFKKPGAIPNKEELNQSYVYHLENKGYIGQALKTGEPLDFTDNNLDTWVYENAEKALEWADSKGLLNTVGQKQFNDVIKKMDEIKPTKSVNYLGTKEAADKSISNYGYYPNMGGNPFDQWNLLSSDELNAVIDTLKEYKSFGGLTQEGISQLFSAKDALADVSLITKLKVEDKLSGENLSPLGEEFLSKSTQTPNQQIDQMFPPKKNNEPKQGVMLSTQQLNPFHVKALKEKGFLKNGAGEPADLTLYKSMPENIKQYYKALDWGDSKGYLNTAGKKQFDDVVKMMDEIEPTKGVQNLLDQGFVESPEHSILYKYDPATETLQAEGKTFVATKLNGEWVTHLDDGTKVTGISIGNLVDEIDMWDGFSAPLSPLGQALKDALKKDADESLYQPLGGKSKAQQDAEYFGNLVKQQYPNLTDSLINDYVNQSTKYPSLTIVDYMKGQGYSSDQIEKILYGSSTYKIPYPKKEMPLQAVSPDEIAGINKPTGPKTVDEFIQFTEEQLGPQNKYGDAKSYSAPGQEGAPIAGAPKPKGSVTPIKQDGIWSAAGYHNEDLGDLMDELIKAGYKVNSPEGFGGISGGALPETLVTPITPQIGLTKGEKIGNAIAKVKKFVLDHGVENNAVATPIAKEYIRINNVMKTQATNLGKLAQRVEKLTGIHGADDSINIANLTPEAKRAVEALKRAEEAFYETQVQFGVKNPLEPADFWEELKLEESSKGKRYSDMLHEYGNAIANKVSDQWMKQQINRLSESIELSDKAGKPIPTSSVSGISDVKLPKAVGDVLSDAVHKIHPRRDKEFTQLFNAINNQLRGMWAAGDASFIGIQQLPTWADNPRAAATAIKAGFHALQDPSTIADFILKHDEAKYGTGSPTVTEFIANGLHIAQATGEGTDLGGIGGKIQSIKGYGAFLKKSNTLFTETGNINRIQMADYLWDQYQHGGIAMLTGIPIKGGARVGAKEGMTRAQVLRAISEASNRATGYSTRGFGGPYGSALFFAPRFMQSQIETVMKASWGNQLENQVARRQMAKLIALGTGITVSINEINGEDTDFDPRSSNFLRIKNIGGSDLSIFGPWDTLVRGIVRSVPHVTEDGDFTLGEPQYLLRSKLSPVLSSTVDFLTGENIVGEPSRDWSSIVKNTFLPFSVREAGEEPLTTTGFGALGMKASPLTETERLENKLKANNILKSDPEYLIKRKEYLKTHPEDVPEAQGKEYKQAREIQDEIAARRKANDELALTSGQTLVDFREKRKNLLTEQRLRLNEVLRKDIKKASSKQQKWLNEYFDLFDNEENKDFITGEINPDKFDEAVAAWANKNGTEALDFVNRYMGAGLNTVEKNYYNDLRKLEAEGYFKLSRYTNMKSDLTEDEIDSIVATVDSFRVGNPGLQDEPWATTAKRLLKSSIDSTELLDVIHSRLKKYQNPERNKLKEKYAKELLWFNPRADWKSYSTYTANKSSGGKLSKPNIGGALKANIKPALK